MKNNRFVQTPPPFPARQCGYNVVSSQGANCTKFPRRDGVREDSVVQQPKEIPLGSAFGLEIPKDPTLGFGLVGFHLAFNVAAIIVLDSLTPSRDVVDFGAAAMKPASREGPIVASANAIP